ncbi:hypothetical protein JKP88DRAFT_276555 [Tribonema minus]|uniref:Uncharacterized protein n=1 Tax=Tribonema minus TaxID=303371 RepID=A0A836CGG5_9STRA|nr:hypothetical protein JKP88DRAFT_276555 [Tribonema minus]
MLTGRDRTEDSMRAHVAATFRAPGSDHLLAALVQMDNVQAVFSILHLAVPHAEGRLMSPPGAIGRGLAPPAHEDAAGDDRRGPVAAVAPPLRGRRQSLWYEYEAPTGIAICLQQLHSGDNDAAATLPLSSSCQCPPSGSVWHRDWRQDDGAWRALRHLLQRAGRAAGLGMWTRAGARRAAPAVAREPGSAQAYPATVLPRCQAALSWLLDAALAATQLRRVLDAANALEAVAAWRSGASESLGGERHKLLADAQYQPLKQVAHRRGLDRCHKFMDIVFGSNQMCVSAVPKVQKSIQSRAVAREPGSAQAPPAAVLPRRQAALSRLLDAALAATQLRRTLRRHLGVERPAPAAARCPNCHKPVNTGAHLRRCTQGLNVTRHNLLADALFQLLKQYAARHGFNKFMDIVFGSNQACLPVPTVQPSADAAQGGARDVQRVLESASQEKMDTYLVSGALDPTTHTLFSAAFDHFGAMSRDTQALLHAPAERSLHGSYNFAQRVAFWRRRTSLALQRALTRVVIDNWNAVIAPDGDVSAYRRIALLQVPRPSPASAKPPAPP